MGFPSGLTLSGSSSDKPRPSLRASLGNSGVKAESGRYQDDAGIPITWNWAQASVRRRPAIRTDAEVRRLERENIQRAIVQAGGKIYGRSGAAGLLGLKPTTLTYRMKALGIPRPLSSPGFPDGC